jgi:HD-GYP domain-containing protein (c-di-GMP phosphodiesterase class II)
MEPDWSEGVPRAGAAGVRAARVLLPRLASLLARCRDVCGQWTCHTAAPCEYLRVSARLRLADLLGGLSIAADLGFGLPPEEAMRSCLIATSLARQQGLGEDEVADTFYTTLLGHIGCAAVSYEASAVFGNELILTRAAAKMNLADPEDVARILVTEVTQRMAPSTRAMVEEYAAVHGAEFTRQYDTGNCEVARATARRIGLGPGVQRSLHEMVEWWNGNGPPQGLGGEEIALPARIARAAADAARFDHLAGRAAAVEALRRRSGEILDPVIVEAFAANADRILAETHTSDPRQRILDTEPEPVIEIETAELPRIAKAFGDVADLKTPLTHGHSGAVAALATSCAKSLHLDSQSIARLEVSALLHDLGRVAVSNEIWHKPGPLTGGEWEQVRLHPYRSERILATSNGLEPTARTAGMHHERLDGSGYHRGCRGRELALPARILAAADAFQAMTQGRLHRPALTPDQAAEELKHEVRGGRLDRDAVDGVLDAAGQRRARRHDNLRPAGLTEREIEVVRLVAVGCSNAEVAKRLVISPRTAEHHVQHIYAKVGVSSRAALALFTHEHDLIAPGAVA